MLSIGQLEQVWVEAEVFERDAGAISQGLAVTMTLDYLPGEKWSGVVDYVYPTLNSKTRTLRVRLKFDNPEQKLKPNMFAQVSIHARAKQNVILVPKESVIRTGKQDRVVLALGEGQFKSIEVIIGHVDKDNIEILSGLTEGDQVVTSAQFLIDSESSKSSDFKRMSAIIGANFEMEMEMEMEMVSSASVDGLINNIDIENRLINISRSAIEKWGRPPATMDFTVADNIEPTQFNSGDNVSFTFEVRDDFVIVDIALKAAANSTVHDEHSNH